MRRNKKSTRWSGVIASLLLILLFAMVGTQSVHAQQEDRAYFFQTGHFISGPFFEYYESLPLASVLLGYPITEEIFDELAGHMVQYFQRGRLEYNALNPPGERVFRTPIGQIIFERHAPEETPVAIQGCRRDPHWQFPVCYQFLDLFNLYGGESSLGVPVSNFVTENGRMTQYFTYARVEWHADAPSGPIATLGDMGETLFLEIMRGDVAQLEPVTDDNIISQITDMRVYAFTEKAILQPDNLQSIYVTVQDQSALPLENAHVTIEVLLPDGQLLQYTRTTNQRGIAKITIKVETEDIGLVDIKVTVIYNHLDPEYTRTSFRIWY